MLGARVNARISERGLGWCSRWSPASSACGSRSRSASAPRRDAGARPADDLILLALGLNGGFLAGLLGVGGGAIAIAVMVFALGTSQVLAQGIALVATTRP